MRLKIDRDHSKQPINGWSFREEFGVTLKEDSLNEMLRRIVRFRESNMLPVGDPEHELALQYSQTHPHLVVRTESCIVKESREMLEFMQWLTDIWKCPPKLISDKAEIQRRSKACISCKWNDSDFACTPDNMRRIYAVSGATSSDRIHRCVIHGWHNIVGCRLSKTEKNEHQPEHCWAGEVPKL
jgi:hypothetical protein